ncbi:M50 family metallopeptidase [Bacillus sp. FJAT-45350]|uniref:M50 family metallopeptidase n=1 Tax=Bacillus sp. FJAT-45350 TaxID=2011014 RepID=UPI00211BB2D5|nr:M50 family metallopeptidase [Bacillus sp. FJAT-45350]
MTNLNLLPLLKKFKIHPLFYFVLGIGVVTGYFQEVIMLFLIVFIHEMGHAIAAHFFKWKINKIELLPFGGVAEMNEAGNRPLREELIVVLAGPIQHLWLMALSFVLLPFDFWTVADHQLFLWHNLIILSFNLLPVWPLDGGRLVQLWFSYRLPYKKAQKLSLVSTTVILLVLSIISLYLFPFHLNLWIVLTFLFVSNYLEWKQRHFSYMRFLMERLHGKNSRKKRMITVNDTMKVQDVVNLFQRGYQHKLVIKNNDKNTRKVINEQELLKAFFYEKKLNHSLKELFF